MILAMSIDDLTQSENFLHLVTLSKVMRSCRFGVSEAQA